MGPKIPTSVKECILSQMGSLESHLRVVICTIAFGMGIDCKDTYRSIHFGLPKTVEFLVQESGKIGRDGNQCFSYVLYNGLLSSYCNQQMKQLIQIQSCRWELVLNLFGVNKNEIQVSEEKCTCCDNCALICQCGDCCRTMHFGKNAEVTVQNIPAKLRPVSFPILAPKILQSSEGQNEYFYKYLYNQSPYQRLWCI